MCRPPAGSACWMSVFVLSPLSLCVCLQVTEEFISCFLFTMIYISSNPVTQNDKPQQKSGVSMTGSGAPDEVDEGEEEEDNAESAKPGVLTRLVRLVWLHAGQYGAHTSSQVWRVQQQIPLNTESYLWRWQWCHGLNCTFDWFLHPQEKLELIGAVHLKSPKINNSQGKSSDHKGWNHWVPVKRVLGQAETPQALRRLTKSPFTSCL